MNYTDKIKTARIEKNMVAPLVKIMRPEDEFEVCDTTCYWTIRDIKVSDIQKTGIKNIMKFNGYVFPTPENDESGKELPGLNRLQLRPFRIKICNGSEGTEPYVIMQFPKNGGKWKSGVMTVNIYRAYIHRTTDELMGSNIYEYLIHEAEKKFNIICDYENQFHRKHWIENHPIHPIEKFKF